MAVILFAVPIYVHLLNTLVLLMGLALILLVLIQRGKGGGLVGAFGGAGGSSPFGSRAGDMFTRITLIFAGVWALFIIVEVKVVQAAGKNEPKTFLSKSSDKDKEVKKILLPSLPGNNQNPMVPIIPGKDDNPGEAPPKP
jgi:preprotein translocase subunit SecG